MGTLLVSAGISAVVGTFFAILTTSRLTVMKVRAQRRESALRSIEGIVKPWQRPVARYRGGVALNAQRDNANHAQDAVEAGRIMLASEALSLPRRLLALGRCRRVFGREYTRIARLHLDEEHAISAATVLSEDVMRRSRGRDKTINYGDRLLQRGLQVEPTTHIVQKLRRNLWLLAHLV